MSKRNESLKLELMRRRSNLPADSAVVPVRPQPSKAGLPLLLVAVSLLSLLLLKRRRKGEDGPGR